MEKRRPHYSEQTGHKSRSLAENFRAITGVKPATLQAQLTYDGQSTWLQRRNMRRTPQDGK